MSRSELATAVLSENDIPECIDPSLASEKQHVKRLYAQETDFYTVIFQNRDGSKTMYSFNEPVKFKDKAGVVRDKSNALKNITASARYAEYRYENKANDIKTYFPQTLDEDKGVVLEFEDIRIELTPESSGKPTMRIRHGISSFTEENLVQAGDLWRLIF